MYENRGEVERGKKKVNKKVIIDCRTLPQVLPKINGVSEALAHALHVLAGFFFINILYLLKD
jgi:hypothetical protein